MNCVQLMGRMVADPEIRYSDGGSSVARFRLAVDRKYKRDEGDKADFISCVAFGKTAEGIEKYFHKGQRIIVTGRIQTGSYTNKDGQKVYTTDVIAEHWEFTESKNSSDNSGGFQPAPEGFPDPMGADGFMNIPDGIDEELPFN